MTTTKETVIKLLILQLGHENCRIEKGYPYHIFAITGEGNHGKSNDLCAHGLNCPCVVLGHNPRVHPPGCEGWGQVDEDFSCDGVAIPYFGKLL